MNKRIASDLTLQRFGRMTALLKVGRDPIHGHARWSCKCDCGNETVVSAHNLKRGQQFCGLRCPLHRQSAQVQIKGQKFGRLTAIEFVRMLEKSGKAVWKFQCECGGSTERTADNVMTGDIRSCGCLGIQSRIKHGKSQTLEYHREAHRAWALKNPAKVIENANKRRSDYVLRVPKWLTDAHRAEIEAIYRKAAEATRETGIQHHVDHEVPLRGKMVSGLHVPWNLKVVTATFNLQKSRRFSDDVC